ncbi:hypothetical protein D3C72_2164850 [compost metagenome]
MKVLCKKNIVANNTGKTLFQKGKEYKVEPLGEEALLILDEFGAKQTVQKKSLKGFFEIKEDVKD